MRSTTAPTPSPSSPAPASIEPWQEAGFGLYVHWPFCQAKCPYCDFNSHVVSGVDQSRWARALAAEIARIGAETPGRVLSTVFFGGGTPSLMAPETVAAVLDAARAAWTPANDLEVTLEANPTSVEAGRFRGYREAGVNRISMGVQAMNDADLRRLGRLHSVAEARAAFDVARGVFGRISFDMIYARQEQTVQAWRAELAEALSMAVDHLSLYQLTIEDGTAFGDRHARGRLPGLPDDEAGADMFHVTQELTEAAGLPAYEISNHARPGAECRHNLVYWRGGDYAAVGPGAHGRLTLAGRRFATEAPRAPGKWLHLQESLGSAESLREPLDATAQAEEMLLMGLRLDEGISLGRLARLGVPLEPGRIDALAEEGFVARDGDRLRVTAAGRPLLDAVLARLV